MSVEAILADFPNLKDMAWAVTSTPSDDYNCIAFAAGIDHQWWEPGPRQLGYYWPDGVPWTYEPAVLMLAYSKHGFAWTPDDTLEQGFEKLAIYVHSEKDEYEHAAKQLSDGRWGSKLGPDEDIEHERLDGLAGPRPGYGVVKYFMKRPAAVQNATAAAQVDDKEDGDAT